MKQVRRIRVRYLLRVGVAAIIGKVFAVPQLRLAGSAIGSMATRPPMWLALVAACSVGALVAYAQLTRTMLATEPRPGLLHTVGIITTSLGLSNVIPGGAAAGGVVSLRMLERAGVPRPRAATAIAATSLGSSAVLVLLLTVGLAAQVPGNQGALGLAVAMPSLLVVLVAALAGHALLRRRRSVWRAARWIDDRDLPVGRGWKLTDGLDAVALVLQGLVDRPRVFAKGVFWAAANWLVDAVALWAALRMVGVSVRPLTVLVAFALANLAIIVPVTPGGIGIVELTLTATLVAAGAPTAPTAAGVAAYRVFTYWLPMPGSAAAYLAVRTHEHLHARGPSNPPAPSCAKSGGGALDARYGP